MDGVLNDLSVAETVALLSCLLPNGFKAASRAPTGSQATAAAGANGGGGGGGRGLAGGGAAPPLPLPTEGLDRAVAAVNAAASRLSAVLSQCGLADASTREFIGVPHNSGVSGSSGGSAGGVGGYVSVELLPAVLAWANGATFEQCRLLSPSTFEGTLVRSLRPSTSCSGSSERLPPPWVTNCLCVVSASARHASTAASPSPVLCTCRIDLSDDGPSACMLWTIRCLHASCVLVPCARRAQGARRILKRFQKYFAGLFPGSPSNSYGTKSRSRIYRALHVGTREDFRRLVASCVFCFIETQPVTSRSSWRRLAQGQGLCSP